MIKLKQTMNQTETTQEKNSLTNEMYKTLRCSCPCYSVRNIEQRKSKQAEEILSTRMHVQVFTNLQKQNSLLKQQCLSARGGMDLL